MKQHKDSLYRQLTKRIMDAVEHAIAQNEEGVFVLEVDGNGLEPCDLRVIADELDKRFRKYCG